MVYIKVSTDVLWHLKENLICCRSQVPFLATRFVVKTGFNIQFELF